jgi:hypothetical protein
MIVQDCFRRLHDAFKAAQAESASKQAVIGDGDNSIDTWSRIADNLEAHGDRIDVAITNVFRALAAR